MKYKIQYIRTWHLQSLMYSTNYVCVLVWSCGRGGLKGPDWSNFLLFRTPLENAYIKIKIFMKEVKVKFSSTFGFRPVILNLQYWQESWKIRMDSALLTFILSHCLSHWIINYFSYLMTASSDFSFRKKTLFTWING